MESLTPRNEMVLKEIAEINTQIKDNQGKNLEEINQKINLITDIIDLFLQREYSEPIEIARKKRHQHLKSRLNR